jgi:hypothetical protein
MRYFPKASIYHSTLVAYTNEHGGLPCRFVSDLIPSKNKTGKIIRLQPQGDETEYWLAVENEQCEAVISSMPQNVWLTLRAYGSRDSAMVDGTPLNGGHAPPMPTQSATATYSPVQPVATATHVWPAPPSSTVTPGGGHTGFVIPNKTDTDDALMLACLLRAASVLRQFEELEGRPATENDRAMAISLFIEGHRR